MAVASCRGACTKEEPWVGKRPKDGAVQQPRGPTAAERKAGTWDELATWARPIPADVDRDGSLDLILWTMRQGSRVLEAVSLAKGTSLWRREFRLYPNPAILVERTLVVQADAGLEALGIDDGKPRWVVPVPPMERVTYFCAQPPDRLYFETRTDWAKKHMEMRTELRGYPIGPTQIVDLATGEARDSGLPSTDCAPAWSERGGPANVEKPKKSVFSDPQWAHLVTRPNRRNLSIRWIAREHPDQPWWMVMRGDESPREIGSCKVKAIRNGRVVNELITGSLDLKILCDGGLIVAWYVGVGFATLLRHVADSHKPVYVVPTPTLSSIVCVGSQVVGVTETQVLGFDARTGQQVFTMGPAKRSNPASGKRAMGELTSQETRGDE